MEDKLDKRVIMIIDTAIKIAKEEGYNSYSSIHLLLSMFETVDSLCHFILNEYNVTSLELKESIKDIFIIKKDDKKINIIINQAITLAGENKVLEEHLFMSLLNNKDTIACDILIQLGLCIEDLIIDVKEVFDFDTNSSELSFINNITKKAKENKLARFIERKHYIDRLDIVLNRRYKNNPLLIGSAGVGKTALVEGYAKRLVDNNSDINILGINIASMISGTKYRGDFEQKFEMLINNVCKNKKVIMFIDEIHTIISNGSDNNLDIANMLKPYLARADIKLIGATTIEEYHKTIFKDKALVRRFQPIYVYEPSVEETIKILFGIKEDYEKYHNVEIPNNILEYLIYQSDKRLINKYRPDKCIDILDDTLSINHLKNKKIVDYNDVDYAIDEYLYDGSIKKLDSNYEIINKYKWLYDRDLLDNNVLLRIKVDGSSLSIDNFVKELKDSFKIPTEGVLELDLEAFKESFMLTSLIGAPSGYIGYDDEGILAKHILLNSINIIVIRNFNKASLKIKEFFINILNSGSFLDSKARRISLKYSIVLINQMKEDKSIGFIENIKKDELFDIELNLDSTFNNLNDKYINSFKRYNMEFSSDFLIDDSNKMLVNDYLYNNYSKSDSKSIHLRYEDIKK